MDFRRQQRIYKTFLIFFGMFLLLSIHLYYIQIAGHERYVNKTLNQDTLSVGLEEYNRGDIYDRNLQPLTGTEQKEKVFVFPALMANKNNVVSQLAKIISINKSDLAAQIKNYPHYLKYDISTQQAIDIHNARLSGVKVATLVQRYSQPTLAAQTIGYLRNINSYELSGFSNSIKKYKANDWVGKAGLEKIFDQELKGAWPERVLRAYVDGNGQLIPGIGFKEENSLPDIKRLNLVLTLDKRMQEIVERVMDLRIKKGAVVVMDAANGDILAMAGRPTYDPNQVENYYNINGVELDPSIQLYQPGSVFKIVVAAAALEEGKVKPDTVFYCAGALDKLIPCDNPSGHGNLTFAQAMAVSCNPTFARVGAIMLGAPKIIEYAGKLGLNNLNIIGYPLQPSQKQKLQLIDDPENIVNSSVGQWPVTATPVQITAMTSVIANLGVYREPRLARELRDKNGRVIKKFLPGKESQVISRQTASLINNMLIQVTTNGTGTKAYLAQGSAGKTGSAEVNRHNKNINAWFTGYAPLEKPKYIVTVLSETKAGESGGAVAAPVFKEIMEQLLRLE